MTLSNVQIPESTNSVIEDIMKSKIIFSAVAGILLAGCVCNVKEENRKMKYPEAFADLRTDAPALRFPVVMPVYGNDDEELTNTRALIRHIHETAGLTEFAIMFPLNPQGNDPYKKSAVFAERFARLRKYVTDKDIKLGILMQQTIGMSATWNKNPNLTLPWQRTVTMENAPSIRFCPLDPDFREYIRKSTAGLFKSKPDFIIFDDDTRLYIQNQVECFCPRHVDYFNRKYGTNYSQSELQNVMKNAKDGDEILRKFAIARRETLVGYISMIRAEIDKVNPAATGIYCTNSLHLNDMVHYTHAAAGKNKSAMRTANGAYLERSLRDIVFKNVNCSNMVALHRDKIDEILDESDTCPHSLFSKSAHTMNMHIIFGLLQGLDGGKLWIANTRFYDPEPIKKYSQVIGKHQGLYRELHRTLKGVTWHGAQRSVPDPANDPHPEFPGMFNRLQEWDKVFGVFGLPYRSGKAGVKGVHYLCGGQIKFYNNSDLERFLSEGCILDAAAAAELAKRGFSSLVGVVPEELTAKISAGEWLKGENYPIRVFGTKQYKLIAADKNNLPEYISEFRDQEYYQSVETKKVCDGAAVFKNAVGAVIVTVPFEICDSRISIVPERQNYMRKIFDIAGALPAWSCQPFDNYFRFGTLADGKDIAAVCNISYEPMEEVNIGAKKIPSKIEKLSADGGWDICKFTVKGNIITINDRLRCADTGIYKFSY